MTNVQKILRYMSRIFPALLALAFFVIVASCENPNIKQCQCGNDPDINEPDINEPVSVPREPDVITSGVKIVLDAGHGGTEVGYLCDGRKEKDDNLRMVLAVGAILKTCGYNVFYTRTKDVNITAQERVTFANSKGVDVFLSIHRNYTEIPHYGGGGSANGLEAYVYSATPTDNPSTLGIQSLFMSQLMARNIREKIIDAAPFADRGLKGDNLYVLRETNMPAVLLELGYISSAQDNTLFDDNFNAIARAIATAIVVQWGGRTPD